jgi:lipid-binding SYLF domain-containing protein
MSAELLSYSRNKGLFAGIDLDGTSVSQNSDDTELYFGQAHSFESIPEGQR